MKKYLLIIVFLLILSCSSCKKNVKLTYHYLDKEESVEYKKGEEVTLKELNLEHQIFGGWLKDGQKVNNVIMDDNIDVYADLQECLEIKLVIKDQTINEKILKGTPVGQFDNPTYQDLNFVGWYTDPSFKGTSFVSKDRKIEEDMTLYAKFNEKQFVVSFDTKGGTVIKPLNVYRNSTINALHTPYLLGYRFTHWSTDIEGKNVFDIKTPVTEDFTLYANYETVDYTGLIDEYIPDVISANLNLPTVNDEIDFYWSTDDSKLLSSDGVVNPKRVDTLVTVTLEIYARGDYETSMTFTKQALVKSYQLDELVKGKVVIGYTSYWYYKGYSDDVLNTVDILDISFGYVSQNGSVDLSSVTNMMRPVISKAHENGIRVCLSIQGYGEATKQFSDCANDPTLRHTLALSMAKVVNDYNLDGIDIDWEYPGSYSGRSLAIDKVNYTLLMAEIRTELNNLGEGYLLTAAIPAGSWGAGNFEMSKLVNYFDYFNMMSYDLENPACGSHHAALHPSATPSGTSKGCSIEETVELWTSQGVPKDKICLGTAFYGKSIAVGSTTNDGLGMAKTTQYQTSYKNKAYSAIIESFFPDLGTTRLYRFDEAAKAPFLFGPQTKFFTTYDNELSILYKCQYALEIGLAGAIIWELGEDETSTLIKSVAQGFNKEGSDHVYLVGGQLTKDANQNIKVKVINEVRSTKLLEDLIFYSTNDELVEITNNLDGTASIMLKSSGSVTIIAATTDKQTIYGRLELTIN